MAYRQPQFQEYFDKNWVSIDLELGDAVFFNPALFHAAGENRTQDIDRAANLLQVSSAFGKPMESIDSLSIVETCWKHIMSMYQRDGINANLRAIVKAVGDGYPFPTNLDRRPPAIGGMAPESETDVLMRALEANLSTREIVEAIKRLKDDSYS